MAKVNILSFYDLDPKDPTAVAEHVKYLLQNDRFICDPKGYIVCRFNDFKHHLSDANKA